MLGHLASSVEGDGLVVVRSGPDKCPEPLSPVAGGCDRSGTDKAPLDSLRAPACCPFPPACHLHQDNRHRSHPAHFASTLPTPANRLSRSKCAGVPQPSPIQARWHKPRQEYFPTNGPSYCPSTWGTIASFDATRCAKNPPTDASVVRRSLIQHSLASPITGVIHSLLPAPEP